MLAASIINNVLKYNKFLGENVITYGDDIMLTTWLCPIFKDNMQTHGRIYNLYQKVNYQTMSKMDRKTIKINGKPTVELDYKHLHPSILYELVGLEYLLDIYDADVHPSEYFDISNEYPQPNYKEMLRKLVKEILLRMINTSSRKLCLASIIRLLDEDAKKEEPFRDFIGVKSDYKFVANSLLERLEDIHFPIEEYFYNESSVILMNHDSNILMHILNDCMEEKIVALPLHDSVVVNVEVKDKVKAIMMDAFKRELGSNANCKVDEK